MRIKHLRLTDFRNHELSVLHLGDLNLIAGRNASGKTSCAMAIEYALTGRCQVTDKAGKGAADLIRVGYDEAMVYAELELSDGTFCIGRSIPSKMVMVDSDGVQVPGGTRELQGILYGMIGASEELITAGMNCSRITGWSAAELKSVAFPLLGVGQDKIETEIESYFYGLEDIGAESAARLLALAAKYAAFTDLDMRYDAIFKARKDAKKARDAAQADLDAEGDTVIPDREKLATLEKQIAERKAERDARIERRGKAAAKAEERDRLDAQIEAAAAELKELNSQAEATPPPAAPEEKLADLREQLKAATENEHPLKLELDELTAELRTLDGAIAAIKKPGDCPVVPGMKCGMTAEQRKKAEGDMKKRQRAKAESHAQLQSAIAASRSVRAELEPLIGQAEADCVKYDRYKDETARRESMRATLEERLHDLQARSSEAPIDIKPLDEEIGALTARIGTGESLITVARVDVEKADRQKRLRATAEETRQMAGDYETLVEAFGPNGFRANLLEGGIGPLTERVNGNLQTLTRGEYQVSIDGADFRVFVMHAGCEVELKHLSASEQVRIGLALTEALVFFSGLGLLILDAAEVLDGPNKNRLISWAMQRKADHQIILLATSEDPKPIEGMTVFRCEAGTVSEVALEGVSA